MRRSTSAFGCIVGGLTVMALLASGCSSSSKIGRRAAHDRSRDDLHHRHHERGADLRGRGPGDPGHRDRQLTVREGRAHAVVAR